MLLYGTAMARKRPYYFTTGDIFDHPQAPADVLRVTHTDDMPVHSHEFVEIVVVTGGEAVHRMLDREHLVVVGDVFVVWPGTTHAYQRVDNLELINVLVVDGFLDAWVGRDPKAPGECNGFLVPPDDTNAHTFPRSMNLGSDGLQLVESIIREMEEELRADQPGASCTIASCALRLVGELIRRCAEPDRDSEPPEVHLSRAYRYIAMNYAERISLAQLTEAAGVSESSLTRAFRRSAGLTPVEYVTAYRVRQSCRLLRYTDDSVTRIAFDVGFSDSNYFSRRFHQLMGVTPVQYRAKSREETPLIRVKESSRWRVQYRRDPAHTLERQP